MVTSDFLVNEVHAQGYLSPLSKQVTKAFHVAVHHVAIDFQIAFHPPMGVSRVSRVSQERGERGECGAAICIPAMRMQPLVEITATDPYLIS